MSNQSSGGVANWTGADFELRLGVQFCVYMLAGDVAGLGPGAVSLVQPQANEPVDDLVVKFESGACWAIQAKAGRIIMSWKQRSRFGEALRQLYCGATGGQIDLSPSSLDRAELAIDHRAAQTVTLFGDWLGKARKHVTWDGFADACTIDEQRYLAELPKLLRVSSDDRLLRFLKKLYVRRLAPPDEWRQQLRRLLIMAGVPDAATADRILDLLLVQIQDAAPHRGQLVATDLLRVCEAQGIEGLPHPMSRLVPSFRLLEKPDLDTLRSLLVSNPLHLNRFVERPELADALSSQQGVLVVGKPGIGKSAALTHLALARPQLPAVVVLRGFRTEDVSKLLLRRATGPYHLIWDDIHLKPDLFADVVEKLMERGDPVRVLCACRADREASIREQVTPDFWRRAGLETRVLLREFQSDQAAEMCDIVAAGLGLEMDEEARRRFAEHVMRGDGGPLFAVATGLLLRGRVGPRVRAGDVHGLPDDLIEIWQDLYHRLADRPHVQSLLHCLRFLHDIGCPLGVRLSTLLYTQVLGRSVEDFRLAVETLTQGLWLQRDDEEFACHDVSLEGVPASQDRFQAFVEFTREGCEGEYLALGLLRVSLSLYYRSRIPTAQDRESRCSLATHAVQFGRKAIDGFRDAGHLLLYGVALSSTSSALSELAVLETTRDGRARLLQKAIAYVNEAIALYRDLGLQADIAMTLTNASNRYIDLASLETVHEYRVRFLQQAIAYVEEAICIRRDLHLQDGVATSLNSASNLYSALAELETDREGRIRLLQQAIAYAEEAITMYRDLGPLEGVAGSLSNVSLLYSVLAELKMDREGRIHLLQQAITCTEEAIRIRRDLGLQADIAMSLNNASLFYSVLTDMQTTLAARAHLLQQAITYVEEATAIFRDLGLQADIAMSLKNASNLYSALAGLERTPEGRMGLLRQAIDCVEEAICLYRDLGLQANMAGSLNNASSFYSMLAALETARERRVRLLQQAIAYIEEAITIFRELGLQVGVAGSLNNVSIFYSALATLETVRKERARLLQQAITCIEKAICIRRELGLQADIAMSLDTANVCYQAMSETVTETESRTHFLQKALNCIEEAVSIFRELGIVRYLHSALRHAVMTHLLTAQTGKPDLDRIETLCAEGETLCSQMGDDDGKTFFYNVRQQLQGGK